jgi:hypothetical protein
MPTILIIKGYRFYFYSADKNELAHIHVEKGNGDAKIWLEPIIKPKYFNNYKTKEKKEIEEIVSKNYQLLIDKWYEFFRK